MDLPRDGLFPREVSSLSRIPAQAVPLPGDTSLWRRFCDLHLAAGELGVALDVSRIRFDDSFLAEMRPVLLRALGAMAGIESGSPANVDEGRMVGHYWLRTPDLAPVPEIRRSIMAAQAAVSAFADDVRTGRTAGSAGPFQDVVHIGIGGSALGPQLLCDALAAPAGPVAVHVVDNADPAGLDAVLGRLRGGLGRTLVCVVSKSGRTPTPLRMAEAVRRAYTAAGLDFHRHAVATTVEDTPLDRRAREEDWLARFPLWDWVGGRTSVTSAVGLLPAALAGIDIAALLGGASAMDRLTRQPDARDNPAALLALMWYWEGEIRRRRISVILPYQDRLALFPRYVQQLVMESLGKRLDRRGRVVHQGLTVYGNKGSTDQHAYVQQLRDGRDDFFATFIRVHRERGTYLFASAMATRDALYERGRDSISITLTDLDARSLGALIALYERAVGLCAELIDVNAYHQPGVDKHVAETVLDLERAVLAHLAGTGTAQTAAQVAAAIGRADRVEVVYELMDNLASNGAGLLRRSVGGAPREALFASDGP